MRRLISEFVHFLKGSPPASRGGWVCGGVERLETREMLTLLIDGSQTLVPGLEGSFSIQFENDRLPPANPNAPLMDRIIGQQRFAPVQLDLLNAHSAVVDMNGVLHALGPQSGRTEVQRVNLATATTLPPQRFKGFLTFVDVEGIDLLSDGRLIYTGGSFTPLIADEATFWIDDPNRPLDADPRVSQGGFLEGTSPNGTSPNGTSPNGTSPNGTSPNGTSPNGTFVGVSGGGLFVGNIDGSFASIIGGAAQIGIDISDDDRFLVTTGGIRQFDGANYSSVDRSSWNLLPDGASVPGDGFKAVTIDPQTGLAIFAVQAVDQTTFEDFTAFYDENGTLLGTTPGVFQDFEIWEDHVVFAVNSVVGGQQQGVIGVLADMSTTTVSELTGLSAGNQIPENGLAGAPAVFLFQTEVASFAAVFETNSPDPPPSLISTILGAAENTPIELTLDNPANATVDGNGVLHVTGTSSGQGALQLVPFLVGEPSVGAPSQFAPLGGSGSAGIDEVELFADGTIRYAGGSGTNVAATLWTAPDMPLQLDSTFSNAGHVEGVTPSGTYFGFSGGGLVTGTLGGSIQSQPGGAGVTGLDMTADDQFLVTTSGIRQLNGETYTTVNLSSWDALPDGESASSVDFVGATIDPRTDNAVFAGNYTDVSTFTDSTAFYDETGSLLGTVVGQFVDFEIWSGYVAFAVNAVIDAENDGVIGILTDMSTTTVSALTGTAAPIPENGLAVGDSAVFLAGNQVHVHSTTSPHAATIAVNYGDGSDTETIVAPTGLASVSHVFPSNGQYSVSVITSGKAAVHSVTVQSVLTQTVDSVTKSTIGLASNGGALTIRDGLISGVDIEVAGQTINAAPDTIRVIGQAGRDLIRSFVDLPMEISTGDGNDRVYLYQSSSNVTLNTGAGNDRVIYFGDGNSQISTGAGRDRVIVRGAGSNQIDGGSGNDRILVAGSGNNRVVGGDGNDRLRAPGSGQTQLFGGAGNDRVFTSSLGISIVSLGVGTDRGSFFGKTIFVTGTLDDDQTLLDALFAELSNSTPNESTLTNLLDGRVTSDTDRDTVTAPMNWGAWSNNDQINGEPTRLL